MLLQLTPSSRHRMMTEQMVIQGPSRSERSIKAVDTSSCSPGAKQRTTRHDASRERKVPCSSRGRIRNTNKKHVNSMLSTFCKTYKTTRQQDLLLGVKDPRPYPRQICSVIPIICKNEKKNNNSCEIEGFVQKRHLCKLCVIQSIAPITRDHS